MSARPRILVHVQPLWGIGHLMRIAALTRAWVDAFDVHIATGVDTVPTELPGHLYALPTVRTSDETYTQLVDTYGTPLSDAHLADRRVRLIELCRTLQPEILVVELYPFGRRALRHEIEALIAEARAQSRPARIVCSLRDVPEPKRKPERNAEILRIAQTRFDQIQVHSDPALIPLDVSYPMAEALSDRIIHTGFVHDGVHRPAGDDADRFKDAILLSAGGGRSADRLYPHVIAAWRQSVHASRKPLYAYMGPHMPDQTRTALTAEAAKDVRLHAVDNRADFPALLPNAALSITQAGYNTALDVLQAGCPALMIPFTGGQEREQAIRADALAARGCVTTAAMTTPVPQLAAVMDQALAMTPPSLALRMDGARQSRHALLQLLGRPQS